MNPDRTPTVDELVDATAGMPTRERVEVIGRGLGTRLDATNLVHRQRVLRTAEESARRLDAADAKRARKAEKRRRDAARMQAGQGAR